MSITTETRTETRRIQGLSFAEKRARREAGLPVDETVEVEVLICAGIIESVERGVGMDSSRYLYVIDGDEVVSAGPLHISGTVEANGALVASDHIIAGINDEIRVEVEQIADGRYLAVRSGR